MDNINLIPQAEIHQQVKSKAIKGSTLLFILIFLAALGVSGYLFYTVSNLKEQSADLDSQVGALRTKIQGMADTEIVLRNLDKKYNYVSGMLAERAHYSRLLKELQARKPEGVKYDSLDVKNDTVNFTGVADNYVLIADYINNLLDKNFSSGDPALKELFTSVSLNSVNLDQNKSAVRFFIVIKFDGTKLN